MKKQNKKYKTERAIEDLFLGMKQYIPKSFVIIPQAPMGKYQVDFIIKTEFNNYIVIDIRPDLTLLPKELKEQELLRISELTSLKTVKDVLVFTKRNIKENAIRCIYLIKEKLGISEQYDQIPTENYFKNKKRKKKQFGNQIRKLKIKKRLLKKVRKIEKLTSEEILKLFPKEERDRLIQKLKQDPAFLNTKKE